MRQRHLLGMLAGCASLAILATGAQGTYHPTTGRFLERDPDGYVDGMNRYEYVRDNPITRTDPLGTQSIHASAAVHAAEVAAAEGTLVAARASQNPEAVRNATTVLQNALTRLNGFTQLLTRSPAGNVNLDTLNKMSSQASQGLKDAQRATTFYQQALNEGIRKGSDKLDALRRASENLGTRIESAKEVIQKHLDLIKNNPNAREIKTWEDHIRKHEQNTRSFEEAKGWVQKQLAKANQPNKS